jgi:polyisoprenoid-binding protein YceI
MQKHTILLIILALILAACASPAAQVTEPAALPATGTEAVTTAPVEITEAPAPEATEVMEPAAAMETAAGEAMVTEAATPTGETTGAGPAGGSTTYTMVPEESRITYEVGETFIDQNNRFAVAIGTTPGVNGQVQVNFDSPQATSLSALSVDVSGLQSDSGRRDRAIRDRFLESARFPTVTFTPTTITGLPETIEPGVEYPLTLQGDLTIRDTTRPATFEARVTLDGDALTGQATTSFLMSEFGFGPIDMFGVLKTEDEVKVTVDFVARP